MDYIPDASVPEEYYIYSGGTIPNTSGSAIVPGFKSSVYSNAANFAYINKDAPKDEIKEYNKQVRDMYIEQMRKDIIRDEEVYQTQKNYGIVIFIIVIILVSLGIGFSVFQFVTALKYGDFSQFTTTIEIQQAGNIVLTTSLLGAIVLTISIVFFFLFLNFVYKPNNSGKDFLKKIKEIPSPK